MSDHQDRGEQNRQAAGIDGTAGDAQDVAHDYDPLDPLVVGSECATCGLSPTAKAHD